MSSDFIAIIIITALRFTLLLSNTRCQVYLLYMLSGISRKSAIWEMEKGQLTDIVVIEKCHTGIRVTTHFHFIRHQWPKSGYVYIHSDWRNITTGFYVALAITDYMHAWHSGIWMRTFVCVIKLYLSIYEPSSYRNGIRCIRSHGISQNVTHTVACL